VTKTIENTIPSYFKSKSQISREKLGNLIKEDFPELSEGTITVYLSKLKKAGIINNPERGVYSITNKQIFNPEINQNLKKIYNKIHKEFPFIDLCVWNTKWLNDLMRHQPLKNYTIIEVEKEAEEQIFNAMTEWNKNVYFNPNEEILERYISSNSEEVIIVKNLVTEAPTTKNNKIRLPTLEKLLVDIIIDKELFAAQQGEIEFIYQSAFKKYTINTAKMKRYAIRRNRETELEKIINKIWANDK
jgi:DNA-binding PadR family transcriptional regulator